MMSPWMLGYAVGLVEFGIIHMEHPREGGGG